MYSGATSANAGKTNSPLSTAINLFMAVFFPSIMIDFIIQSAITQMKNHAIQQIFILISEFFVATAMQMPMFRSVERSPAILIFFLPDLRLRISQAHRLYVLVTAYTVP